MENPSEREIREFFDENGIDRDVTEKFIADFANKPSDTALSTNEDLSGLEMELLGTTDWRRRATLAARIIAKRYEQGY